MSTDVPGLNRQISESAARVERLTQKLTDIRSEIGDQIEARRGQFPNFFVSPDFVDLCGSWEAFESSARSIRWRDRGTNVIGVECKIEANPTKRRIAELSMHVASQQNNERIYFVIEVKVCNKVPKERVRVGGGMRHEWVSAADYSEAAELISRGESVNIVTLTKTAPPALHRISRMLGFGEAKGRRKKIGKILISQDEGKEY